MTENCDTNGVVNDKEDFLFEESVKRNSNSLPKYNKYPERPNSAVNPDELIKYIDESGSSSCNSSFLGDTSGSLGNLLDRVGVGSSDQFSIDALNDLDSATTTLSCGYGSLDTRSETGSDYTNTRWRKNQMKKNKIALSDNTLADDSKGESNALENKIKLLKPSGEHLLRRSLGCSSDGIFYNNHKPLPGEQNVVSSLPRSFPRNKQLNSLESSGQYSCNTSHSSIRSSNRINSAEFIKDQDMMKCSSLLLLPPQCTPPPVPTGESSYVTSASSSYVNSCSSLTDVSKTVNFDSEEAVESVSSDTKVESSNSELIDCRNEISYSKFSNEANDGNISVPLADMEDEFSESKSNFGTIDSDKNFGSDNSEVDSETLNENDEEDEILIVEHIVTEESTDLENSPCDVGANLTEKRTSIYNIKFGKIVEEAEPTDQDEITTEMEKDETDGPVLENASFSEVSTEESLSIAKVVPEVPMSYDRMDHKYENVEIRNNHNHENSKNSKHPNGLKLNIKEASSPHSPPVGSSVKSSHTAPSTPTPPPICPDNFPSAIALARKSNHRRTPSSPSHLYPPPPYLLIPPSPSTSPQAPHSPFFNPSSTSPDPLSVSSLTPSLTPPHHYISSLRVASSRGTADMGGALVVRVAAFLRTQYKSHSTTPIRIAWCPKFTLSIAEFDCTVSPMPVPGQQHANTTGVAIPGHAVLRTPQKLQSMERKCIGKVLIECGRCYYARSALPLNIAFKWATQAAESGLQQFSVVFVLTLRDFKGGSLFQYLCKEILPKHILSKEAMNTLWNYLHKIDDKLLFLLIGWDELSECEGGDLIDLVEGKLLPNATVVMTSRVDAAFTLQHSLINRVYRVTGLTSDGTKRLLSNYCQTMNKVDFSSRVVDLVVAHPLKYGALAQCPVTALALAILFEDMGGKLPSKLTDFYSALLKHMTRVNLLRRGEPMCYDALPEKYTKLFQDFGKLSLESLKSGTPYFTPQELKCSNGSEVMDMGLLLKMQSYTKHTKREHYSPTHCCLQEFMAAYYLAGLITNGPLLQQELDSFIERVDITRDTSNTHGGISGFNVIQCLVGLLGRSAHTVINMLAQMRSTTYSPTPHSLLRLLRESGRGQMNIMEVCKHVSNRDHVTIQTQSSHLDDWGRLLYSPDCSLETLEILLDLDSSSSEARDRQDVFFSSLSFNESATHVKLTCVLGGSFGEQEVTRLVSYVRSVLTKKKLEGFELQVTSVLDLESDSDSEEKGVKKDSDSDDVIVKKDTNEVIVKRDSDGISPICDNSVRISEDSAKPVDTLSTHTSTLGRKRTSVYAPSESDLEMGISNLEHSVSEMIAKVGDTIGDTLIKCVTDDEEAMTGDCKDIIERITSPIPDIKESSDHRTAAVLSPVVEMVCDTLSAELTPSLVRLVLALDLNTAQVDRICTVLSTCPSVQTLHLPRLSCAKGGLMSLSKLMAKGRLKTLNLAGSVSDGTPIDDRSGIGSNLISMTPSPTLEEESPFTFKLSPKHPPGEDSSERETKNSGTTLRVPGHHYLAEKRLSNDSDRSDSFLRVRSPTHRTRSRPPSVSSNNNQHLLAFWSFMDAEGNRRSVFNSLPRSFYQSLSRRVMSQYNKRSQAETPHSPPGDSFYSSMISKPSFPPPTCNQKLHDNGLHELLHTLKGPSCRVNQLDLSKCSLGAEDLVCLGETVRVSTCLTSLHMEGTNRVAEIVPIIIGLQFSQSLQLLDLSSPHLLLGDAAVQIFLCALSRCTPLRFLVISGWSLQLESDKSLSSFTQFLANTQIQHLELAGVRLSLSVTEGSLARLSRRDDLTVALSAGLPDLSNDTIAFLNMDNVEVIINNSVTLRGPYLLYLIKGFPRLLDLSLACTNTSQNSNTSARNNSLQSHQTANQLLSNTLTSPLSASLLRHHAPPTNPVSAANVMFSAMMSCEGVAGSPPLLQEEQIKAVFSLLADSFATLKRINLSGWMFSMENSVKVLQSCGRSLKLCGLREVVAGGITARGGATGLKTVSKVATLSAPASGEVEHLFLGMLTSHLSHLTHLSIVGLNLSTSQAYAFGKTLRDRLLSPSLCLHTRSMEYSSLSSLRQVVSEGGRHTITYLGGSGATYLVTRVEKKQGNIIGKWMCGGKKET